VIRRTTSKNEKAKDTIKANMLQEILISHDIIPSYTTSSRGISKAANLKWGKVSGEFSMNNFSDLLFPSTKSQTCEKILLENEKSVKSG
jgi:hypothetical protein